MFALKGWLTLPVLFLFSGALHAADLYVATSGNDTTGNGSFATPYRTIQKAANTAVAGDNVIIRAGTYRETVRPANSGTAVSRITYKAYESSGVYEEVIISGADPVTGWTAHDTTNGKAIYKTSSMSWNLSDTGASFGTSYRNQLFVNGQMQVLARWPNVPADRITRLTYQDLALVSAASGQAGSTATSAWLENADVNATFPPGYWNATRLATARVFLSPATMIWGMSVKIASQATNRLNLDATGTGFSFTTAYYYPTTNNRFYLYDWYEALDTAGEYWKDIATNTLYLWAPSSANPATLNVEARKRDFGLSLGSRSYLTFQGIKLFACTVDSDAASVGLTFSEIEARYFAHIENLAPTFTTAANPREFYLRGDGHVVQDSYFFGSANGVIGANGTNMRIENNVIRDFGYSHAGSAIFARNGALYGNRTLATKNQFLRNTAFNGGHTIATTDPALDIKYNRFYNSHLRGSDVGAVGIASTDGLGSEIAYNVISDALGPKDTGVLYGGFGIYFDFECRNYTVHHNIVYNTTGGSYQIMPNRAAYLSGVTNMGMKFYHNTGDADFGIIEPQDVTGVDVRNNLIRKFGSAGGAYTGLPNVQFSNNTAYTTDAAAPFRDRTNHDLRFATGSSTGVNAGTVISPYSDGFTGAAPDTGALEFDVAPFIAGASFTQRQLSGLTAANIAQLGAFVDIQFGNLPEGRSPPTTFQAQIGSEAFGGTLAYDYSTNTWRLLGVSKGALTGLQTVTVRLSGSSTAVALETQMDVGGGVAAPEIVVRGNSVSITDGDATPSGTDHTTFADTQSGDPNGPTQTYIIYNYGSLPLTLGAVTFTGAHAANFSVVTPPASTVASGASTSLVVRFSPSATGLRTATLHLINNDADEADFDFAIQGQGTSPLPELNLPTAQLTATLAPNSTGSVTLPIQNIGLANLTWNLTASAAGLYSWADSTSGGPAYSWYDIASLGTRHWGTGNNVDDSDTTVTLPFTFPFYGGNFTQLKIGSNGILSPGTSSVVNTFNNVTLPNVTAPANLIAAFWDDLFTDDSAQIRSYAVDGNTFVVLYENVKSYSSVNRVTFQVVLRSNGQITVQFRDNQFTRSYTIGLQNAAQTLGPQVAYSANSGTIEGLQLPVGSSINRAITFYPPASFVTGFTLTSGTIAAGASSSPLVNFSASGLAVGSYSTTLTLTSNDASESSVQIPLTLQVLASAPAISAGQSSVGFLDTALNYTITASASPTSYALASGTLPAGITLNTSTGVLSGTPTAAGTYTPSFTATNALGTSPAVALSLTVFSPSLIVDEPFAYAVPTNSPDPDTGANSGNGLPVTNTGGTPSGTSTGLRGTWGTTTDATTGLTYSQGSKTLTTSGAAARVNNADWGGQAYVYKNMSTDPWLPLRVGGTNTGNLGIPGTSLYVSLLGQTSSATADAFRLSFKYDALANFYLTNTATGWALNGTPATGASLALNTPTLFVLRFDFGISTTNVSLWVNPPLGQALGTAANATITGATFPGLSNFQTRSTVANAMTFDELRVGTSLSSVTPFTEPPPVITAAQSSTGSVGNAFTYDLQASGTPTSYALASGSLPPGITLNTATGRLSGLPTSPGTYTPGFTATNAYGTSPAVTVTLTILDSVLLISEPFAYTIPTNSPDPDGGANAGNGLPALNLGGTPSGTSTGLRGAWGTTTDAATGLGYSQGSKTLVTTGAAARVNNATWGGQVYVYQNMGTDPWLAQRVGGTNTGNIGAPGTSLYVSLLGQTSSATADAFRLSFKYDGTANFYLTNTSTGWALNNNGAGNIVASGVSLALNTPTLFVLRFDFGASTTNVSLWVNPPLGQALGTANATITGATFPGFNNFQTRSSVANAMTFDELRIGTSLGSITPYTEATALATFRTTYGLASDGSADLLTPAADGVPNLLKYAFNMLGSGTGQAPTLATPNASVLAPSGSAGLPFASIGTGPAAGKLQLTFIRRKSSASPAPGITYSVEFSNDFASWAANPSATESATSLDATFERVTATDSLAVSGRRFARVKVSTP